MDRLYVSHVLVYESSLRIHVRCVGLQSPIYLSSTRVIDFFPFKKITYIFAFLLGFRAIPLLGLLICMQSLRAIQNWFSI